MIVRLCFKTPTPPPRYLIVCPLRYMYWLRLFYDTTSIVLTPVPDQLIIYILKDRLEITTGGVLF